MAEIAGTIEKNHGERPPFKTGWGLPPGARKFHYFGADGRSLCRHYVWLGLNEQLDDENDASPDNCVACKRRKLKS